MKKVSIFSLLVVMMLRWGLGNQGIAFAQQSAYFLPQKIITLTCKPTDIETKDQYKWLVENIENFLNEELISLGFLVVPLDGVERADFILIIKYNSRSIKETPPKEQLTMTADCELIEHKTNKILWSRRFHYDGEVYSDNLAVKEGKKLIVQFSPKYFQNQYGESTTIRVNDSFLLTRGTDVHIEFVTHMFKKFSHEFRYKFLFGFINNLLVYHPTEIQNTFYSADSIHEKYILKLGDTLIVKQRATDPEGDTVTAKILTSLPEGAKLYTFSITDSITNISRGGAVIVFIPKENQIGKEYLIPFKFCDQFDDCVYYNVELKIEK